MKTLTCNLLSISILFCGCFVESSITKDDLAPDDIKVCLYLKNGSYIKSYSERHHRVEDGYQVTGNLTTGELLKNYAGVINDNDIERITAEELNVVGTLVGSVFGAFVVIQVISLGTVSHGTLAP